MFARLNVSKSIAVLGVLGVLLSLAGPPATALAADDETPTRGSLICSQAKSAWFQEHKDVLLSPPPIAAGQEDFDVTYYDIDLNIQTTLPRKIFGVMTMKATVVAASMDSCTLDLRINMAVTSVTCAGSPAGFVRNGTAGTITIALDRTYTTGELFEIVIEYNGTPSGGSFNFESTTSGLVVWTLSEPFGARTWWPCKDRNDDKADSVDMHIELPNNFISVSNGILTGIDDDGTRATYHWSERYPIAPYLVSIACHPYAFYNDWWNYAPGESMEVQFYVYPPDSTQSVPANSLIVDMLSAFTDAFGMYPFVNEKYGHAQFGFGGGMEHQTCTSLGVYTEDINAHELGHQWFGDMITCEDFHHCWLNEGFASYTEAIWHESYEGISGYHDYMATQAFFEGGTIFVEDPMTQDPFALIVYDKGSWVVHMLRGIVGDAVFFDILDAYYNDPGSQYASATTEDFQAIAESVSGLDLNDFFQQWIYGEYYPIYQFDWSVAPAPAAGGAYNVNLGIDQIQAWQLFHMPIQVTVSTASGDTVLTVDNSAAHTDYVLTVNDVPTGVALDKDNWILRQILGPIPTPTFDRGILVVNGVDWDSYGTEITSAYDDSVFWGDNDIAFWDCFDEPAGGYPSPLPAPLGHGAVPPDTLKQFTAVVWVGNNYNGDLASWNDTPIWGYLNAGGNVLLMTRWAQSFISPPLADYLGIVWTGDPTGSFNDCTAQAAGLVNIPLIGSQNFCAVFDETALGPETTLLFADVTGTVNGLGAIRQPALGGEYRPDGGGRFAFLSGRPYRFDHDALRANVEYILSHYFNEPIATSVASGSTPGFVNELAGNLPNPFNPRTTIRFSLAQAGEAALRVYDVGGRLVTTLMSGPMAAGPHAVDWNGRDEAGNLVSSGVYFYQLESDAFTDSRKMILLK